LIPLENMNLSDLLARPNLPTELTGDTTFDLEVDTEGDVPSVTGDFDLRAERIALQGYAASAIDMSGRFEEQALVLRQLTAQVLGGRVAARGRVDLPVGGRTLAYDLSGSVSNLDVSRLPDSLPVPDVESRLSLTYNLRDRGTGPTGRARLQETRLLGATIAAGTELTFDMSGEQLAYTAEGRVGGLNPQALAEALAMPALAHDRFDGEINASFSASGRGAYVDPLNVTVTDSRMLGGFVPRLTATVRRTADITEVDASGSFQGLQPNLAAERLPPGDVTGSLDISAALNLADGKFDWRTSSAEGSVLLSESRVGGVAIERMALSGAANDAVVELREFAISGPTMIASASGTVALDGATPTNATYQLTVPQLGAFAELLGRELGGGLQAQGEVAGTETLRIIGSASGSSLQYGGTEATSLNVKHDVHMPPTDPAAATVGAQIEGELVRIGGRTLTTVTVDASYGNRALAFDAVLKEPERTLESGGRLVLLPEADGQQIFLTSFRFEGAGAIWQLPAGTETRIDHGPDRIVVEGLRLETADGQVMTADGVIGRTTDEGPLVVTVSGMALEDLDALLLDGRGVAGRLSAEASLTGPMNEPGVAATFSVEQGGFGSYKYGRLHGALETAGNDLEFDMRLEQDPTAWLDVEGTVPRSILGGERPPDAALDIAITSSPLGLGFVSGFTDAVQDVQGTLQADVRVTGTPDAPSFDGRMTLTGGAFRIAELGTLYTGLDTVITFEPDALVLQEFSLLDENGQPMRVAGRLPYTGGGQGPVTIEIDTDNFEVIDNQMGDLQVSTDLSVTGTLLEPRVEGTVHVTDGTLRIDEILGLQANDYYRAEPLDGVPPPEPGQVEEPGLFAGLPAVLSLTLEIPALVLTGQDIRGPGSSPIGLGNANITVEGDLRLEKGSESPLIITGDISTVRGTYEFQGRQFDILRDGQVRFPGLVELDPLIDISAERLISGVRTQVRISGTLERPELTLSSQPPLDEADILSLIVFNQPVSTLGTAEQVSLGRRAASLASGFVASQLAESIGSALELDILEIDTGASPGSAAGVTLGEQLGERLFLRVRQGFGSAGATQLMVEYEFTDWLRLQSTVSDESGGSDSLFQRSESSGVRWIFLFSY
jgi:autotransporter translocation and assembly factor TamB